ncbi:MAG TPA: amidohydrolase family protein [Erysipelotrichaceae bacterium]|jgi:predicted TIM-barrel fold metal-dependent hydrolase|nr:amidohydrolase [Erysipelotrichia bacterium]HPX31990.1 amidohydrolase family protein [Erysipelotrichaceae bacterium]HQA84969.1 amidohydrolase family protein [Erysipelotrichaceae bacterium]
MKLIDYHVHMGKSSKGDNYTLEDLIASMDKFNIEKSGLSILNGVNVGPLNDLTMEAVKKYPDRIVGYAYINPREENAIEEVHRCLSVEGMRGVKFHSWKHGYFPSNNRALDGIIDAIAEYDVPILTHTGTPPLSLPQQWIEVAKRHPNVKFVLAHIGYLDYGYDCIEGAKNYPNIYVDTSGQVEIPVIAKALEDLGPDRIIWSTDWPYKYPGSELVKFEPYNLSEEDKKKIFYENAMKLWKLI